MTYTYKLARRLARLRAFGDERLAERLDRRHISLMLLPLLIVVAACAAGEPTGPSGGLAADEAAAGPIVVSPRRVTLESNQRVLFNAFSSALPGSSQVTSIEWTASGGSITGDGTYSSSSPGKFKVVGKRRGNPHNQPDTSTVIVVPEQPVLAAVTTTPATATLIAGQQQQFDASGTLSDGSTVAIGVTWTATGGSIDAGGLFSAGNTDGTYRVIATHPTTGKADTSTVTVKAVRSLTLTPADVALAPSGTEQYGVTGSLSDGSTAPINSVAYSASAGSITESGIYTAPTTAGSYAVSAKLAAAGGTPVTTSTGVSVSADFASDPGGAGEPTGMTPIVSTQFAQIPTSTGWSSVGMDVGQMARWQLGNTSQAFAGSSPVWQQRMANGLGDGDDVNGKTDFWLSGAELGSQNYSEIYVRFRLRVTGNGGSNYENQATGTKLFYFAEADLERQNHSPLFLGGTGVGPSNGAPNGSLMTQMPLLWYIYEMRDDGTDAGGGSISHLANVNYGAAQIAVGRWYTIECYAKMNSASSNPAPRDGIARIWVNGVLTHDYSPARGNGIRWRSPQNSLGFYNLRWDPVWGGDIGQVRNRDDYIQVADLYVSKR